MGLGEILVRTRGRRKRKGRGVFKGDGDRGEDLEVVAS